MSEIYLSMDEVIHRIKTHPDVKTTNKAQTMLRQLGTKQDLVRKPRQHITNTKKLTQKKIFIGG